MWPIGDQCCWTGYGFWPLCPKRYIISCESVNRVLPRVLPARSIWTFFYLYSNYKKEMTITWICFCVRSVLFPKQGNRIKVVVPNSICILGIFCLKQGQGFKPSAAQIYSNTGRVQPRDSSLSSFCIFFYHTNSPLPCSLPESSPTSTSCWPSTSTCPTDCTPPPLIPRAPLLRPPSTDWPLWVVGPCPQGLLALLPRLRVQPDSIWESFSFSTSVPLEEFD